MPSFDGKSSKEFNRHWFSTTKLIWAGDSTMRWILIPFNEMEKKHVWVGVGRQFMDGSEVSEMEQKKRERQ